MHDLELFCRKHLSVNKNITCYIKVSLSVICHELVEDGKFVRTDTRSARKKKSKRGFWTNEEAF